MDELKYLAGCVERVYVELYNCTLNYRRAARELSEKEGDIEVKKAMLYDSGEINGRNAEVRDAQVKLNLFQEFEDLELLKQFEEQARTQLELARTEVERVRALLRIEEIIAERNTGQDVK